MKKTILALSMVLVSTSFAKTYKCVFTEPFINVKFKSGINVLVVKSAADRTRLNFDIEAQSYNNGKNIVILDSRNADVILSMNKTGKGTDGMSDNVYEYEASYRLDNHGNSVIGGCNLK